MVHVGGYNAFMSGSAAFAHITESRCKILSRCQLITYFLVPQLHLDGNLASFQSQVIYQGMKPKAIPFRKDMFGCKGCAGMH